MARNDKGNEDRDGRSTGGQERGGRERERGAWGEADDYYGNRGGPRSGQGGQGQGGGRGGGELHPNRGEHGTSGSESGRGYGAPWGGNREPGNSEYDHGPFDDGGVSGRSYGQGMYNQRPGQQGQEGGGYDAGQGQNWGASARGSDGGRDRGNSFGNTDGDRYGGGGFRGGYGSREQHGGQGGQGGQGGRGAGNMGNDYGTNSSFSGGYSGGHAGGSRMSHDAGAQARSHAGRGPKGWKRSDERIRDDVSEQLERHHEIDASDIEVQVQNGELTLSGTVDDRRSKRLAEDIAESVPGVVEVLNQIRVKRESSRHIGGMQAGTHGGAQGSTHGDSHAGASPGGPQIHDANPAQGFGNLHAQTTAQTGDQEGHTADQRETRGRKGSA